MYIITTLLDAAFETKAAKSTLFLAPFSCERVLRIRAVQLQGVPHTSGSFEIFLCQVLAFFKYFECIDEGASSAFFELPSCPPVIQDVGHVVDCVIVITLIRIVEVVSVIIFE